MEDRLYHRICGICNILRERKTEKLYLYPFGNRGIEIKGVLQYLYTIGKIVPVDDGLGEYSREIINFDTMAKAIRSENAMVLLTADNPIIYGELRIKVKARIPDEKVLDCFEINPLVFSDDQRIVSLVLTARQIYSNKVEGAVAEAGVYQGEFAKYINILFPDRKLYLFDTFSGFESSQVDALRDNEKQTNTWIDQLKDTAVDLVMSKMKYKDNVIVKKGVFPDTAQNIEDSYVFVNLDMDLYKPTYEGLLYFWQRLNPGGYIFVHDFGNWDGIKEAVLQFCERYKAGYVCINDGLTVCIAKPLRKSL